MLGGEVVHPVYDERGVGEIGEDAVFILRSPEFDLHILASHCRLLFVLEWFVYLFFHNITSALDYNNNCIYLALVFLPFWLLVLRKRQDRLCVRVEDQVLG